MGVNEGCCLALFGLCIVSDVCVCVWVRVWACVSLCVCVGGEP